MDLALLTAVFVAGIGVGFCIGLLPGFWYFLRKLDEQNK
jgi:hypothetical protein